MALPRWDCETYEIQLKFGQTYFERPFTTNVKSQSPANSLISHQYYCLLHNSQEIKNISL